MKITVILSFILCVCCPSLLAQGSSYEDWARQKREKYDKWKKLRAEIDSRLPGNTYVNAIENFLGEDLGFSSANHAAQQNSTAIAGNNVSPQPQGSSEAAPSSKMKIWAVVVGVASYRNCCVHEGDTDCSGVSCLNYTDDDAYRMYAFYNSPEGGSLPDSQIRVLVDEEATRPNIMAAFRDIFSKAGQDDAIIFYFSGHGAPGAFVTREYDNTWGNEGFIEADELNAIFDKSPAKYKYIIADACHSGSFARKGGRKSASATEQGYYSAFERGKSGYVSIFSSMSDEYSQENAGIRQGVFSYYLLRGLKGEADTNHDKMVSVIELFDYVDDGVKKLTQGKQNPVIAGNYDDALPIAIVRE
jgi:hypothetical protein